MNCVKCGNELPAIEGPGRPRRYCGDACQRAATMEIKRLDSRIAKLERDESTWRIKGATQYAKNAAKEIESLELRLALLVGSDNADEGE